MDSGPVAVGKFVEAGGDRAELLALDIQTPGLHTAWPVQIGVTDRKGNTLFDELVNPLADITPEAS